jgi:DNA-binding transcriptional LysR family regulator
METDRSARSNYVPTPVRGIHKKFTMTDTKGTASLDWEDVRFFTVLARHGTLATTARALKVTHATVSRRLASLEATLGHSLFTRNAQGFALNAAGASALAEAAQMEMAACALTEKRDTTGTVPGLVRSVHRIRRRQ